MSPLLVPIVEGKAEVESVPVLLRRVSPALMVARPFRIKRHDVVRAGKLENAVNVAIQDRQDTGAILVLLDADDDCPAQLGPQLLGRCQSVTNLPVAVVVANREFEAWFLGAKESLRGTRGIRNNAVSPADPERIRGAKEHLNENMEGSRNYNSVDDQAALVAQMDLGAAGQRCPSFDKFLREIRQLSNLIGAT